MTTLLINASLIWLLSLLVYELLLKKETFHRLNRAYLLLTFACGLVLPLLPWEQGILLHTISQADPGLPLTDTPALTPADLPVQQPAPGNYRITDWISLVYIAGAAISLLLILKDLLRIIRLYRQANRHSQDGWTIAATGVAHGPFSLMHIIFVSSREQYTDEQWKMLLQHEQQHHRNRHILDLLLLQTATVVLWFHPLVHLYRHKLQLIHEYEVDSLQDTDLQTYGHFLLEQSMLQPAPAIAHSFNYSPLKNRIQMMTRTTSKRNRSLRFLLLLPMMGGFIYCCAQNKPELEIVTENSRTHLKETQLAFTYGHNDTVFVEDPQTGARKMLVARMERPYKLDGLQISMTNELKDPVHCINPKTPLSLNYVIRRLQLQDLLSRFKDATYIFEVNELIIGVDGYIKSFSLSIPFSTPPSSNRLDKQSEEQLLRVVAQYLFSHELSFSKGLNQQGKPTPYMLPDNTLQTTFEIRNGQFIFNE